MPDALMCGRCFSTFDVVDDFSREALAIEIDLNLPAPRIIRVLERVALLRGYPDKLRPDNWPEFISLALADWAENEVRRMTEQWWTRYNNERPRDSLNDMTPVEYLQAVNQPGNSKLAWD